VTFDIASLILASALVLIGFQLVCFYALARLHTVKAGSPARIAPFRTHGGGDFSRPRLSGRRCASAGGDRRGRRVAWLSGVGGMGRSEPSVIARPAAFAVVTAALGVQAIMAGFLWGLIGQRVEEPAFRDRGAKA
jgi:hypothetical protein